MDVITKTREKTNRPMYFGLGRIVDNRWIDTQRVFVVGDDWPGHR